MSLEPALAFHSLKSKGSTLLDTANKFEFQSRTPIEDAIKVVMVCSNQNDLDDLLQFKRGSQARKQKNASVQVNFENRAPMTITFVYRSYRPILSNIEVEKISYYIYP